MPPPPPLPPLPPLLPPPLPLPLARAAPPVVTIELVIDFFAVVLDEVPLMLGLNFELELECEWELEWELALASSMP